MSKKEVKAAEKVSSGSNKTRKLERHLKNHPNDLQSKNNFKGTERKKPKNKMGWIHATFRNVSMDFKKLIVGKNQHFIHAAILKMEKKTLNEMRHKSSK